jgi:hypothetical protein
MVTGSEVVAVVGSNVRRCHLHGRGGCFVFCCFIFTFFELQTLSLSVCVSFSDRFFNGGRQMLPEFASGMNRNLQITTAGDVFLAVRQLVDPLSEPLINYNEKGNIPK